MGKRKGSKKRRRPEDDASSRARRRARTPVSRWSDDEEQPEPEHEEAGPSRLPDVQQVQQVHRWADEDEVSEPEQGEAGPRSEPMQFNVAPDFLEESAARAESSPSW